MAAFLSRTVDALAVRGGRRAAAGSFSELAAAASLGLTTVAAGPNLVRSDGADLWVAAGTAGAVSRVRASDGKLLETWTGAPAAYGVLVALGRVLVTGSASPGVLYRIDPGQAAGAATAVASNLGNGAGAIAFDGARLWTANQGGSVSIVTPQASIPWTVTTVASGFAGPAGVLFDGANVWVADSAAGKLFRLDPAGAILQTVTAGTEPRFPIFDGANVWVPNRASGSVTVVRASSGAVLATLTGNGLGSPNAAAFDGSRVLVVGQTGDTFSLWKAADLSPIGFFLAAPGSGPLAACSDGISFWIALHSSNQLARF
jgi:hypothetical protein